MVKIFLIKSLFAEIADNLETNCELKMVGSLCCLKQSLSPDNYREE